MIAAKTRREELDTAAPLVPNTRDLRRLREVAAHCLACPAGELGTQTVFGVGPRTAEWFLIGEQPGNEEDLKGEPFVGPAGAARREAFAQLVSDLKFAHDLVSR